jgi:hypothetical protein
MKYCWLILILFFQACGLSFTGNNPAVQVEATDSLLRFRNGLYYYNQSLLSGSIVEYYQDKKIHRYSEYLNGKQEGDQLIYFSNGKISEKRYYENGEKAGTHTGFWENGHIRFEYHFENGQYEGDFKQWYRTGKPYTSIRYRNGIEEQGKGWRENGKIYMSYVMKEGRRYGMMNPNLCYTLQNEKGEFLKSSVNIVANNR